MFKRRYYGLNGFKSVQPQLFVIQLLVELCIAALSDNFQSIVIHYSGTPYILVTPLDRNYWPDN